MKTAWRLLFIVFLLGAKVWANAPEFSWYTQDTATKKVTLNVELFLSSTCPHCQKADAFFSGIAAESPDFQVHRNLINEDKNALLFFNQLLSEQHQDDFAVPSIYFCNSRWVGFATAETTGKDLLHAMNYCKQQIQKNGVLTPAAVDTLRHWANANQFDAGMVEHPSVVTYIVTIAITDAFSPCAFFSYAAFLALLFVEGGKKKQITASFLFILSVGIMHYFQQVHTSLFYQLIPWLRVPALLIGLITVYFVVQHYKKFVNSSIYLSLAFLLGAITTAYQQTCVMNWSYIYEQWLNNQHLSNGQMNLYQLFYQSLYVFPLVLTLVIYLILHQWKRFAAQQQRLVVIGLLFILAIALLLIAYPMLLSNLTVSVLTLFILVICSRFINWT